MYAHKTMGYFTTKTTKAELDISSKGPLGS